MVYSLGNKEIAIVNRYLYGWRGGVRVSVGLANGLANLGYTTYFVSLSASYDPSKQYLRYALDPRVNLRLTKVVDDKNSSAFVIEQICRSLAEIIPLNSIAIPSDWLDAYACSISNTSRIIHFVQALESPPQSNDPCEKLAILGLNAANIHISVSYAMQQILASEYRINAHVIHPFVEPIFFKSFDPLTECSRFNPLDLLFVGSLKPAKGFDVLLEALCSMANSNIFINLVVATQDSPPNISSLPISVKFIKPISDLELRCLYKAAQVVVVPSLFESFCLVAVESMAVGTPLILSDSGGFSDYARNGINCLVFKSNDPKSLEKAIYIALSDHQASRKRAIYAKKTVSQFTIERMIEKWAFVLENNYV